MKPLTVVKKCSKLNIQMFKLPKLKEAMPAGRQGFTLIEMMVVITLIAILSTIALFGIGKVQAQGRDVKRASNMNGIRTALERYYADNQKYPANNFGEAYAVLVAGGYLPATLLTDPNSACTTQTNPPATGVWIPCGGTTNPQYSYSSAAGAYAKGTVANCTVAQGCYFLWLKSESSGTYQEYSSPQ